MPENDKITTNTYFGIGDLIVNKETNNIGILMEKHRLIKSSVDARVDKSTWEWAWSIKSVSYTHLTLPTILRV